jgi:hypothetical protein
MRKYTATDIPDIMRAMAKRAMVFFSGEYDLNVIFIRSKESQSDKFDDVCLVIYQKKLLSGKLEWVMKSFECTTDPGKNWLLSPINVNGTLIIVPGQYKKAFRLGYHNRSKGPGKMYRCLEQVDKLAYVLDNSRDSKLDFSLMEDPKNIFWDIRKTNIHRASQWAKSLLVGLYSAGCLVMAEDKSLQELIELVELQQATIGSDFITMTLLNEDWV